jgi:RNA polymerase sigma-70 factor (ECF subfamily)
VDQAFTGWLYRIARNLSVDTLQKDNRHGDILPETLISPEPELEDVVLVQDERESLQAAMAKLTVEQREVIQLRFHEDRTSSEVAILTGRTESAVKALQHRALGALARAMGIERQTQRSAC